MCVKNKLHLIRSLWLKRSANGGFDQLVCQKVKITQAGDGFCEAEFRVEKEHTNIGGLLHGGFSAYLVDSVSTMALLTDSRQLPGVSLNINLTYLKAAKIGEDVLVKATADKIGKNVAFLSVKIVNKQSGDLLVEGKHTKYIV